LYITFRYTKILISCSQHLGLCTGGTASKEYLRDLRQRLLRTADALLTSVQASHARQAAADGTPTAGIATQTAGQSHSLSEGLPAVSEI